jgi:hypothetical protein
MGGEERNLGRDRELLLLLYVTLFVCLYKRHSPTIPHHVELFVAVVFQIMEILGESKIHCRLCHTKDGLLCAINNDQKCRQAVSDI